MHKTRLLEQIHKAEKRLIGISLPRWHEGSGSIVPSFWDTKGSWEYLSDYSEE
ncbi:MAG: hypothetical protein BWY93_00254 [Euryarchaeota archaeon ADurb.BinA087]|nr:MAG: hypothetical protein BWY93_00254 [Euryarchaeota archaeon ADurb.BinA087]